MSNETYAADRPVFWKSGDGRHWLIEATDEEHLAQDAEGLMSSFLTDDSDIWTVWVAGLTPWERLSRFGLRVFTLLRGGWPMASFSYSSRERRIVDYKCPPISMLSLTPDDLHVPVLCAAFHALRDVLPLGKLPNSIASRRTELLSPACEWVEPTLENARNAVAGRYVVPGDIGQDDLAALCANGMVELDVSALSERQLAQMPADCAAWLVMFAPVVVIPHLRRGGVKAVKAKEVVLAAHEHGDLDCCEALRLEIPQHRTGNVFAPSATDLELPLMENGNVTAASERMVLPLLRVGYVTCEESVTLDAPRLELGSVSTAARLVSLPALAIGTVEAPEAMTVNVPVLEVGMLMINSATSLSAPNLRHAEINGNELRVVDLPELVGAHASFASAETVSAPKMEMGILRGRITARADLAPNHGVRVVAATNEEVTIPAATVH